jgi:hypothetical protein
LNCNEISRENFIIKVGRNKNTYGLQVEEQTDDRCDQDDAQ